jgi:4-hydroxybenzoate polyprenyltransferase
MQYGATPDSVESLLLQLAATFPFCLWLFGWNDLEDRSSDQLNPRKGSWIFGGRVNAESIPHLRTAIWTTLIVPLLLLLILPPISSAFLVSAFAFGWAYSVPPLRLKEIPILDGTCSAAILASLFAAGFTLGRPVERLPLEILLFLPAIVGMNLFGTLMDREPDQGAGHRTAATRFGVQITTWLSIGAASLSAILIPLFTRSVTLLGLIAWIELVVFLISPRWISPKWGWVSVCGCSGALIVSILLVRRQL